MIALLVSTLAAAGAWQCRNPVEIACSEETCTAAAAGEFTPMDISADRKGRVSVCAYSGCWETQTKPVARRGRLLFAADGAAFSTSPSPEMRTDITLIIDERSGLGFVMAGGFAHPLVCAKMPKSAEGAP